MPYAAPAAVIGELATAADVPEEVLKKIRNAWVVGAICGVVTLAVVALAIAGTSILGYSAWELFDVALIFGLTYGIYRKSRTCAVLMLVYFVASKILLAIESGRPNGMVMGLIFTYYFYQGVVGTFAYHKAVRMTRQAQASV